MRTKPRPSEMANKLAIHLATTAIVAVAGVQCMDSVSVGDTISAFEAAAIFVLGGGAMYVNGRDAIKKIRRT